MAENKITSSESSTVPKNEGSTVDKKKTSGKVTVDPKEQAVAQDAPATQTETAKNEVPEKKDAGKMRDEMKESVKKEPAKQARAESKNTAETVVVKKGGSGLALLALLVALGLGAAGYYFGLQQVDQIQHKLSALEQQTANISPAKVDLPTFEQERQQIAQLIRSIRDNEEKLQQLEKELAGKEHSLSALQNQVNRMSAAAKQQQPNDWLLSEADFLLNNALRKLVLDNDVDTGVSLLKIADETLEKMSDPRVSMVRTAINNDLKQLLAVNNVDQNVIMQRLSQLANTIDELTVLDVNFDAVNNNEKLTDSLEDWKENAEKSATSFLNHFIRITPRNTSDKVLLAPNQDIYLRENIRLRLQIAIMAVPRQQDELYKQSLETVASWIRSYFDTNSEVAQNFLKTLDELAEQSIYVDVPTQLQSLNALDKLLDRPSQDVKKIELSVDKALVEETTDNPSSSDAPTTEQQ
ncbi:uroporphyrinogen-III C-methyltransferase [Pasteurella multocida]|uniref:uroporphyrinogen-III C-methyltransferase n=1 Tax=Pasteurella multocida TaxID=747 RepID=UPI000CF2F116|nr:uroporphyrinogen-III C-methyltransferase [Pasteurella multocida]MDY0577572.1 uroporphyrinogen-III C-methyltransferase [Pasteurella multocida]MEB3496119.1 uroporphyrinogen-III C-methyltransferase [Pasteurella multocida]MEB3500923.1 uroporphyrinogen-III C-methyltransferase [Pasteurella multocida]MEB3503381.1 uroporphyrinogen-III C-methyltransferase [Pasteurella multocida]HDR1059768.1 uroporphyrinogen-III C-methyltransferase [Pasteurella multocida]